MNARHRKILRPPRPQSVYEILWQRAEEAAERDGMYSNTGLIQRLRKHMFADVDALEKSGAVKIPE